MPRRTLTTPRRKSRENRSPRLSMQRAHTEPIHIRGSLIRCRIIQRRRMRWTSRYLSSPTEKNRSRYVTAGVEASEEGATSGQVKPERALAWRWKLLVLVVYLVTSHVGGVGDPQPRVATHPCSVELECLGDETGIPIASGLDTRANSHDSLAVTPPHLPVRLLCLSYSLPVPWPTSVRSSSLSFPLLFAVPLTFPLPYTRPKRTVVEPCGRHGPPDCWSTKRVQAASGDMSLASSVFPRQFSTAAQRAKGLEEVHDGAIKALMEKTLSARFPPRACGLGHVAVAEE